jgi:hypothetical protein
VWQCQQTTLRWCTGRVSHSSECWVAVCRMVLMGMHGWYNARWHAASAAGCCCERFQPCCT